MRVEYELGLDRVEVPCFSVEATEGPAKLFTLATLAINVMAVGSRVDLVFHSPNEAELGRKIDSFLQILASAPHAASVEREDGEAGAITGYYFRWISIRSSGGGA
jgi:hypothetical protein